MTDAPDGGPNKRRPERDRVLLDLGTSVRTLQTEVSGLRDNVRESAGYIAEAMPRLEELENDMAEVKGTLEALTEEVPEVSNPPVEWPALPAEDAEKVWDELAEWVADTLVPWLQITRSQLPDMWPSHRRAVFELLWLRTCYRQAYMKTSHPTAAAEWHTRWLDAALENVRSAMPTGWDQDPQPGAAQPQQPQQPPAPGSPPPGGPQPGQPGYQPAAPVAEPWRQQYTPPPAQQPAAPQGGSYSYGGWRDQLATREHWHQAWEQAKAADVQWRRDREQRQAEQDRAKLAQNTATTSTDIRN